MHIMYYVYNKEILYFIKWKSERCLLLLEKCFYMANFAKKYFRPNMMNELDAVNEKDEGL